MGVGPRKRATDLVKLVGLCLLIVALVPIWALHRLVSGMLLSRRRGSVQQIRRVSVHDIPLSDVIQEGRPVVIEGLLDLLDLATTPDLEGLRDLVAVETGSFEVRSHKGHSPYFLYTGDYGAELDRVEQMTLEQFLDDMFGDDRDLDTCTYRLFGVSELHGAVGRFIDEIAAGLEPLVERRPDRQASGIWIGSKGVVTPLHHDAWTGLLFQMHGSKRVVMFSPLDRPNLYFTSPFAANDRWSALPGRSSDADPDIFPRYRKATRYEARIQQGEVLFIPPYWSHEVEALEPNISIPFRFATRAVEQLNPGFLRPACEVFHHKIRDDSVSR